MLVEMISKLVTQENFVIPISGENYSLWDLMFNPYVAQTGGLFWEIIVALVCFAVWMHSQSAGLTLALFIILNATMSAAFFTTTSATLFWAMTVLGVATVLFKALVGNR